MLVNRFEFAAGVRPATASTLVGAQCSVDQLTTFVLDLAGGEEAVWAGAHRSVRKSLRVAQRAGVVTRKVTERDVADVLPALLTEAYAVRGVESPYAPTVGRWVWPQLADLSAIAMSADLDGHPAGVLVAIPEGQTLFLWAGGAFRAARDRRASHALHAAVIDEAIAAGYQRIDFCGSADEGVAQFKMSFGAAAVPYLSAEQTTYGSRVTALARAVSRT